MVEQLVECGIAFIQQFAYILFRKKNVAKEDTYGTFLALNAIYRIYL